jgi:hypothetical protein
MRRRTGLRCARMRSGRATRLMLTPRQRGDPEHQQNHQPVLQHLFTCRSAIHYCLLIVQLLNANPDRKIICRTAVRRRFREAYALQTRNPPIPLTPVKLILEPKGRPAKFPNHSTRRQPATRILRRKNVTRSSQLVQDCADLNHHPAFVALEFAVDLILKRGLLTTYSHKMVYRMTPG